MYPNLIVAFITGLTAGGIGCLVVQSGLLASSLAHHFERDHQRAGYRSGTHTGIFLRPGFALTISLFLLAKLIAYTFLGFLLGVFGSVLQLTPMARAALMVVIGIFIVGNGLRMFGAHSVFRWFVLEPPSGVIRFIRRASKNGTSLATPLFLGALTVLLPCGISQAMMATALASGDPFQGAALLFAFTLGTSPLFFAAAYFATRLGVALEAYFTRIVALILLVLGTVSLSYGLNLAGVPVSLPQAINRLAVAPASSALPSPSDAHSEANNRYVISVSDSGYTPEVLHLPADRHVTIIWAVGDAASCARAVVIPGLDYETVLPPSGEMPLTIAPQQLGTVLSYSCSTGRRIGQLVFDLQ